jgi:ribosomal protein S18 acetylase RimI-like enzyme
MTVLPASAADIDGMLSLAAEVEHWFGSMVDDPGFRVMLTRTIQRGAALVVREPGGQLGGGLLGGLLTGGDAPAYRLNWLVVTASARRRGVGRALVDHALDGFTRPCRVDVVTFGTDHPAVADGGARAFYERLGFRSGAPAPRGPEGGTRQWYHLTLPG